MNREAFLGLMESLLSWLVETTSYVLRDQCQYHKELKPYLEPLLKEMHSVGYRVATPNAARKALEQLAASGLLASF